MVPSTTDGRTHVSGDTRSDIVRALGRLRKLPIDLAFDGGAFDSTITALEAALSSPMPVEMATYYRLASAADEAIADAMSTLYASLPMDETSPQILLTYYLAKARAQCFDFFASVPNQEHPRLEFLLKLCGVHRDIEKTVRTNSAFILPLEAAAFASEMTIFAGEMQEVDTPLSAQASALACSLRKGEPMTVCQFFSARAEMLRSLISLWLKFSVLFQLNDDAFDTEAERQTSIELLTHNVRAGALSVAACEFLAGCYVHCMRGDAEQLRFSVN